MTISTLLLLYYSKIKTNWQNGWENIKGKTEANWELTKAKTETGWQGVKTIAQDGWETIKTKTQESWENIKTKTHDDWENFKTNWQEGWETIKTKTHEGWENTKEGWKNGWQNVTDWWSKSGISKWWNESVVPYFNNEKWKNAMSGVPTAFTDTFNRAVEAVKEIWNKFANWLNGKLKFEIKPFSIGGKQIFEGKTINLGKIPTFATGGFIPKPYSIFAAGESGIPELMGTVGGKTAVAGGTEITGIADAVYSTGQTEASLLQTAVSLLEIIAEKEYGISNDAVFKSVRSSARNYSRRTGRPAFDF